MSNIAGSSLYSSTNTSTSTLRPRNPRLISYIDDAGPDTDLSSQAVSSSTSASTSRGASPGAAHSRSRPVAQTADKISKRPQTRVTSDNTERRPSSGLWDSWSSIQGVASSLFGAEGSSAGARKGGGNFKTPVWMKQDSRFKPASAESQWGPGSHDTGAAESGSIEERQAIVQAKKREALLLSCAQEGRDALGRHKRKGSSADIRTRSPTSNLGEDALVYRHMVQPQDTLAGVMIKYGCQQEVFRKVNRFWPNDNIQTRTQVLLPVNACSVRGRRLDDLTSTELLARELNKVDVNDQGQSASLDGHWDESMRNSSSISSPRPPSTDEIEYKHDSYVMLPSFSDPIEILRISRKSLGYFPPARRKSTHATDSVSSTPRTSFDTLRHPPTHAAQQAAVAHQASLSLNASPVRRPRLASSSRQRSSSTVTASNTNSGSAWILRGPGGVGTLRGLRTDASRPGPSEDPLNQKFAKYLPDVAPPPAPEDISTMLTPRAAASRSPYRSGPRLSTDSTRSTRSNSSTFGAGVAGVENFMRKLTASTKKPELQRSSSGNVNAMGLPVGGETGLGDLIELETNPDALHHMTRGRKMDSAIVEDDELTPTASKSSITAGKSSEERLLNERFPIRGRITRAYGAED